MDLYTLGEKKCALYAVIPDNNGSFNFLVSLLVSVMGPFLRFPIPNTDSASIGIAYSGRNEKRAGA